MAEQAESAGFQTEADAGDTGKTFLETVGTDPDKMGDWNWSRNDSHGRFDDGIYGLNRMTVEELVKIKGIGTDKAVTLCAALEMGRRLGELKIKETYEDFSQPFVIAQYVMERLRHEEVEHVWAAMLTSRNKLIQLEHISNGGLVSSLVEQRAVFKKAIACNAAAIILIHNHPSGDSRPSDEDIRLTKLFVSAGQFMGIPVLDHIVIGDNEFTSLSEIGKLS